VGLAIFIGDGYGGARRLSRQVHRAGAVLRRQVSTAAVAGRALVGADAKGPPVIEGPTRKL